MVDLPDNEYQELRNARELAESTINTIREPLIVLDADLKVISASRSFYAAFKVKPEETERHFIYDLGNKQWDIPSLRKLLEEIIPQNESFDNYEVEHEFPVIGRKIMLLNARRIPRPPEKIRMILLAFEDITQNKQVIARKEAEVALRESDEQSRLLNEMAQDAIFTLGLTGNFLSGNKKAEEISGKTREELIGKPFTSIVQLHDVPRLMGAFKDVLMKGDYKFDAEIVRKDGSHVPVEVRGNLIKKDGKPVGVFGIARDITERRLAERMLQALNDCFLSFGADPIKNLELITIATGKIMEAVCVLYNRKEGDLLKTLAGWQVPPDLNKEDKGKGHICFDVIAKGGDEPVVIRQLQNTPFARTDPNVKKYDLQSYVSVPVKLGNEPVASLCAVYQRDFDPVPVQLGMLRMLGRAASIEEGRKRIIEQIQESEAKYRAVVENAKDIIYTVDTAGIMTFASPQVSEYGYSVAEVVGSPLAKFVHPDDLGRMSQDMQETIISGRAFPSRFRLLKKDGSYVPVEEIGKTISLDGKVAGITGIIRDITERKRAELALEAKIKELEKITKIMEGREDRIIELKQKVKELEARLK